MKKILLNAVVFFIAKYSYYQIAKDSSTFNFDFEKIVQNKFKYWDDFGSNDYTIAIDSTIKYEGHFTASIINTTEVIDYKALSYVLPGNYNGKKITISGYIKTENVSDGYAGLWIRIDPNIAFDNMQAKGIKGTTDWKKYEVTVNMNPANTKAIVMGGLLVGKGKMWLDGLRVTIDGKDVADLTPIPKKIYGADNDKAFGNASKIDSIILNETNAENLKMLGLIWGFVKYYHPNVAAGNFNFDNELFRIATQILAAKTKTERDISFVKWIKNLGEFEVAKVIKIKKEIKNLPDLDWIEQSDLSSDLKIILK